MCILFPILTLYFLTDTAVRHFVGTWWDLLQTNSFWMIFAGCTSWCIWTIFTDFIQLSHPEHFFEPTCISQSWQNRRLIDYYIYWSHAYRLSFFTRPRLIKNLTKYWLVLAIAHRHHEFDYSRRLSSSSPSRFQSQWILWGLPREWKVPGSSPSGDLHYSEGFYARMLLFFIPGQRRI